MRQHNILNAEAALRLHFLLRLQHVQKYKIIKHFLFKFLVCFGKSGRFFHKKYLISVNL